jgi:molybdopterin converting factor small subunit
MVRVKCTSHLYKFFPGLSELQLEAQTVAQVVAVLDDRFPGLADYVVDETGALRKHVNIFIGDTMIDDRQHLQDALKSGDLVFIMQALSGG